MRVLRSTGESRRSPSPIRKLTGHAPAKTRLWVSVKGFSVITLGEGSGDFGLPGGLDALKDGWL